MGFLLAAGTLALAVSGLLALALVRSREDPDAASNQDMRIYRDQLEEVDRDVSRGTLAKEEARQVRVEVSRRLLEADRTAQAAKSTCAPRYASIAVVVAVCAVVFGGSAGIYLSIGAPGYPDLPLDYRLQLAAENHESRISQAEAEALGGYASSAPDNADPALLDLMEKLRATVAERPDDLMGLSLLARYETLLENYAAAHAAQARLIAVKGADAIADDHATHAEQMVLATAGFVSPEAEAALRAALLLDPNHGPARYYTGLLYAQSGRPDLTFVIWQDLLEEGPSDAVWISPILAQIKDVAQAAGIRYVPQSSKSPPRSGPAAEDIKAADELSVEEREEMIRGMVDGLAERIESGESDAPVDWARLIRSLGVLGETGRASRFWSKAQQKFADDLQATAMVRAAAISAGVAQ